MRVLGLIPARGGSKGFPGKNLAPLGGRPLLAYTCEQAKRAKRVSRVVLSTEDDAIAHCGLTCGVEVPFRRPAALAEDVTPMLDVVRHALETLEREERYRPDAVVVLQPTSPLRRPEDIDEVVRLLEETGADSVVTVMEVPHQFNPSSLLRLDAGRLVPYLNGAQPARRQDKPALYARNGPAVLAVRREVVLEQGSLYGADCRPVVMPADASVDIDGPADLRRAADLLGAHA